MSTHIESAPCPVCVSVHPVATVAPPTERLDPSLSGSAAAETGIRSLTEEDRARRVREEWNVEPIPGSS